MPAFPSYAPPSGEDATGPHNVSLRYGGIYVPVELGGPAALRPALDPDPGWLVRARMSGTWTKVADLAGYEEAANPDRGLWAHLDGGGVFVAGARHSDRCGAQLDGAGPRRCELRGRADQGRGPDHRDDMVTERQLSTDRSLTVKIRGTAAWVLVMWLGLCGATSAAEPSGPLSGAIAAVAEGSVVPRPLLSAELFARTELFFGSLRSDKPPVSEQDFLGFLHDTITPLFPNGLTLLTGLGQFLTSQGVIQQEQTWLLILLYPVEERRDNHGKIEAIRAEYKKAFAQKAVLRSDRCCEWVGF